MTNKNWATLIIGLIAAINSMLMAFGTYHLTNNALQGVDQIVSWVVTFAGVVVSHRKPIKSYFTK